MAKKGNPFADLKRRLPYKALLRREAPLQPADAKALDAAVLEIAGGSKHLVYAGSAGDELGCGVVRFDTEEKAKAMQAWIASSGIESRPCPEPLAGYPQLKVGGGD